MEKYNEKGILVYTIGSKEYSKYIKEAYNITEKSEVTETFTITPCTILDHTWSSAYGNPYGVDSFSKSRDFSFNEDFNCLSPSTLESHSGVIKAIASKYMQVELLDGNLVRLHLGACSRLESTKSLPEVGQKIIWRGNLVSPVNYNVYRASCI